MLVSLAIYTEWRTTGVTCIGITNGASRTSSCIFSGRVITWIVWSFCSSFHSSLAWARVERHPMHIGVSFRTWRPVEGASALVMQLDSAAPCRCHSGTPRVLDCPGPNSLFLGRALFYSRSVLLYRTRWLLSRVVIGRGK